MAAADDRRIVDSSVLIGFPIGGDHEYARYYEGKRLFYCSLSVEEVVGHFVKAAYKRGRRPEPVPSTANKLLSQAEVIYPSKEETDLAVRLLICYEKVWLEGKSSRHYNDMLIGACSINRQVPVISHDRIFLKLKVMFPDKIRLDTTLPALSTETVSPAKTRLAKMSKVEFPV